MLQPATQQELKSAVRIHEADRCDDSLVLYNSRHFEAANLVDLEGKLVHSWSFVQGGTWHYAELLPGGHLGAIIKEEEGKHAGMYIELDWDSRLVRRIDVPVHHDFDVRPDGNIVLLCREYVDNPAVYQPGPDDPAPNTKSDFYLELTPDDNVAWEWHSDDHALSLKDFVEVSFPRHQRDWAHTNTVEILPDNPVGAKDERFRAGNVLFSMRQVDTVGVIDKRSGEIVWAWGPGVLQKQHMPTILENGNILIFDNGTEAGRSRVLEVDPLSGEIVWQYVADPPEAFFSGSRGSSERLRNGNTFVAESNTGRLFEVTPTGEIVWEFVNPDLTEAGKPMAIYRAMRYPREFCRRG